DPQKRSAWKLDEALRGAGFLAGLQALDEGKYEQAAERFREVGRLGLRDRRLGALLILALFKAGQQLIYWDHEFEMQNGTSMDEAQQVVESPVVHSTAAEVVQQ